MILETADSIGLLSKILRDGKGGDDRLLKKNISEIQSEKYQPGFPANFRVHLLQHLHSIAPALDDVLKTALDEAPHLYGKDDCEGPNQQILIDMLRKEASTIRSLLAPFADQVQTSVSDNTSYILEALSRTHAFQNKSLEDMAFLLLETIVAIGRSSIRRINKMTQIKDLDTTFIGFPSFVISSISHSTMAKCLRVLMRTLPGLDDTIEQLHSKKFVKLYTLPVEARRLVQEFDRAKNCLKRSGMDAMSHIRLGKVLKEASESFGQQRISSEEMPKGSILLDIHKPEGDYLFSMLNKGQVQKEITVININGFFTKAPTPASLALDVEHAQIQDILPQFSLLNGDRLCISEASEFAGMSYDQLPAGAEGMVQNVAAGVHHELMRIVNGQPLLMKNNHLFRDLYFVTHGNSDFAVKCDKEDGPILESLLQNKKQCPLGPEKVDPSQDYVEFQASVEKLSSPQVPMEAKEDEENIDTSSELDMYDIFADSKIEQMRFSELDRLLLGLGMEKDVSQGKGSHMKYINPLSEKFSILSHKYTRSHNTVVKAGIIKSSFRSLQLNQEQLICLQNLLKKFS